MPLADYPHLEKARLLLDQVAEILDEEMNQTETLDASDALFSAGIAIDRAQERISDATQAEDEA